MDKKKIEKSKMTSDITMKESYKNYTVSAWHADFSNALNYFKNLEKQSETPKPKAVSITAMLQKFEGMAIKARSEPCRWYCFTQIVTSLIQKFENIQIQETKDEVSNKFVKQLSDSQPATPFQNNVQSMVQAYNKQEDNKQNNKDSKIINNEKNKAERAEKVRQQTHKSMFIEKKRKKQIEKLQTAKKAKMYKENQPDMQLEKERISKTKKEQRIEKVKLNKKQSQILTNGNPNLRNKSSYQRLQPLNDENKEKYEQNKKKDDYSTSGSKNDTKCNTFLDSVLSMELLLPWDKYTIPPLCYKQDDKLDSSTNPNLINNSLMQNNKTNTSLATDKAQRSANQPNMESGPEPLESKKDVKESSTDTEKTNNFVDSSSSSDLVSKTDVVEPWNTSTSAQTTLNVSNKTIISTWLERRGKNKSVNNTTNTVKSKKAKTTKQQEQTDKPRDS